MTRTMVPQAPAWSLRRVRDAAAARPAGEDHLHYDRGARVWRTHAEIDSAALVAAVGVEQDLATAQLQECA